MNNTIYVSQALAALRGQSAAALATLAEDAALMVVAGLPRVGASDPTATVSSADIAKLDAQVNTLQADFASKGADGSIASFAVKWVDFLARWKIWFGEHGAGTGFFGGSAVDFFQNGQVLAELNAFTSEYNELLREWTAPLNQGGLSLPSAAKPAEVPSGAPDGVLDALGGALKTAAWIAAGVAVAVVGFEVFTASKAVRA